MPERDRNIMMILPLADRGWNPGAVRTFS